jgi:hypothetical protein
LVTVFLDWVVLLGLVVAFLVAVVFFTGAYRTDKSSLYELCVLIFKTCPFILRCTYLLGGSRLQRCFVVRGRSRVQMLSTLKR